MIKETQCRMEIDVNLIGYHGSRGITVCQSKSQIHSGQILENIYETNSSIQSSDKETVLRHDTKWHLLKYFKHREI